LLKGYDLIKTVVKIQIDEFRNFSDLNETTSWQGSATCRCCFNFSRTPAQAKPLTGFTNRLVDQTAGDRTGEDTGGLLLPIKPPLR